MQDIFPQLDKVRALLQDMDFLQGKGLSNEVNIRIFCYDAQNEPAVRHFTAQLLADPALPCRLVEKNIYTVFLDACAHKRILERAADMEARKGKDALYTQLQKAIPVQAYVEQICAEPFQSGDVLLLTGVGDAFPFMRIHTLLEALQPKISVPILVFYPGMFDGRHVRLFDKLPPNPYYRAFSVI